MKMKFRIGFVKNISAFLLTTFIFTSSAWAGGLLANTDFSRCTPAELKNHISRLKSRDTNSAKKEKFDLNDENIVGKTILLNAAKKTKYAEIIKILVSEKANVNVKDPNGMNALMIAARYNPEPSVTKELIKSKVNISEKTDEGMTALMFAAKYNPKALIIEYLIEAEADPKEKNNDGLTALDLAKIAGNTAAIEELTKDSLLKLNFMTCSVADIRARIKSGADVNEKDKNGATPLMLLSRENRNPSVIKVVLKSGADIMAKDSAGKNAIDYARERNNIKIEKLLVKEGVPEPPKPESEKPPVKEEETVKKEDEKKAEEKKEEEKKAEPSENPEQQPENVTPPEPPKKDSTEISEDEKDNLI